MQIVKVDLMNGTPAIDVIIQDDDLDDFLDFVFEAKAAIERMYEDERS